ncbi:hypothetical protein [Algiphilus sp.]|uniref:hypothetical protein n=1 Tax=Algiphilus sp. TaxID=1872431 RepID=UPI003B52D22D
MSTGTGALLFIASMLCFAVGFGAAWLRARRRVQARIHDRLRQEMEQRMAEEVLRRLRDDSSLHEDIEKTLREQGYATQEGKPDAPDFSAEPPPDSKGAPPSQEPGRGG